MPCVVLHVVSSGLSAVTTETQGYMLGFLVVFSMSLFTLTQYTELIAYAAVLMLVVGVWSGL